MSDAARTLARITGALGRCGARYMVVGSFASAFHGEPRTTQDIDIVVDLDARELEALLAALPPDAWYADGGAARSAVRDRRMFNVIDLESGWKVDIVLLKADAFSRSEFARRTEVTILGTRLFVATPEDTILAKLAWARAGGGSERQIRDVAGIVAARGANLDFRYVDRWSSELGVADLWRRVREG